MIWLILILITADESNQVGMLGNPLALDHSCTGNTNIDVAFVSGLPTGGDIQYNFNIEEQHHQTHFQINNLGFDSNSTDFLVFQTIIRCAFNVNTLTNDIALLKLKSEAVFDEFVQPECRRQTNNYKKMLTGDVFRKEGGWGFDFQDIVSSTLQQMTIPMVSELTFLNSDLFFHTKPTTDNVLRDTENSVYRGDSGSEMVLVSGWGVVTTTKELPTKRCHWPAFWLVVCPWYGMHHCQSKIL